MIDANKYLPVTHGMRLGFKVTLILACVYAVLGALAEIGRQMWLTQELRITLLPIVRMGWAGLLPFSFLWAVGWALVVGTLSGGLLGDLWKYIGRRLDGRVFALLALALCASIVVGLHVIFQVEVDLTVPPLDTVRSEWPSNSFGLLSSYPLLVGVPSIVYVLTGAWGSYFFWRVRPRAALEPPSVEFLSSNFGEPE